MNVKWHQQNVLPRRAPLEQRLQWHRQHQEQCGCRPIPASLRGQLSDTAVQAVQPSAAEAKFQSVLQAFAQEPAVTYGGKGFGSRALKLGTQMFALLSRAGEFVVRLSRARAEELVAQRKGQYFDPGHGRLMKEWLVISARSSRWLELAREAHTTAQARSQQRPSRVTKARARKPRAKAR
jgi:hypothetical protein